MDRFFNISTQLILALLFLSGTSIFAQKEAAPPTFRFELFELPNGILGNHVQSITQDSFGFMWFGSQYGLHRWDGYQFRTYLHDPLDSTSLSSSYVEYIYVAKDGTLWLGTWGGGLNHFDYCTESFVHYFHDPDDPESISNNYVTEILEDREGYLWASTQKGVNRLDRKTGEFKQFLHDPEDPSSLSYDKCRAMFIDSDGILWFGTGWAWENTRLGGLNRYHPQTGSFTRYNHDPNDPGSLISNKVFEIFEDSKGNFWVGTAGDGLHLMDRKTGTFTRLENRPGRSSDLSAPYLVDLPEAHVKFIYEDQDHKLWIGSWLGGIKYYDPETNYIQHYHAGSHPSTIPDDYAYNMFQSRDGTLWSLTAGDGGRVFKIIREDILFYHFGIPLESDVQAFHVRDQVLWMSTSNSGLWKSSFPDDQKLIYKNDPKHPFSPGYQEEANQYYPNTKGVFDGIYAIEEDQKGYLWLATTADNKRAGLMRFHPETGELQSFFHEPGNPSSLSSDRVMDILQDKKGNIWIATANGDLNRFLAKTNAFQRYAPPITIPPGAGNWLITKMALARDGSIWLGGGSAQPDEMPLFLFQFHPETGAFKSFDIKTAAHHSKEKEWVHDIREDAKGNIWMVTRYELRKVNPSTGRMDIFQSANLGSSTFYGLEIDDQGLLWLTGNGLTAFDPAKETSFTYKATAGIESLPFYPGSIYKSADGYFLLGGRGGFQYFRPEEIKNHPHSSSPEVIITDFQLPGKAGRGKGISFCSDDFWNRPEIRLRHDQNVFSIRFAVLDFLYPGDNRHDFQLVGYDEQWRTTELEPLASYVRVPPGDYTFRVRAANHNGVWGEVRTIRVLISPPWWATWWAYALYGILALSIVLGMYRFQLNRKLDQAEAHRLRELDAVKTQLYTNITHEFRTPLTVILGMARQVLEDPKEHFRQGLEMIIRNGENLLSLVNQMLDLSRMESGKISLNLVRGDAVSFLKYLLESFHSLAESKGIQIHFLSGLEALTMDYDAEKLQQIVSNLLSNALKFTPEGGHIYFSVSSSQPAVGNHVPEGDSHLIIKVKDTGKGIPEEKLPHIFDRFYQVDGTNTKESSGSGIGLALTRELVNLMEGKIAVKSREGKGTELIVMLPVKLNEDTTVIPDGLPVLRAESFHRTPPQNVTGAVPHSWTTTQHTSNPTLLIVEDNPDVVQYLSSCLAGHYQLSIATDGQEGIDMAIEIIPDLVILDVMMPQKDGFEVCQILRNEERTSHIPVIMLTAKADVESKLEGLERGADAYLAKPFHKEELLIRLKKLLELRRKLQSHYLAAAGLTGDAMVVKDIPRVEEVEEYFVRKVRKVVIENLNNFDFSVEQLCKEIGMSNSQLHRKLTALTGFSATKFIRYMRLNRAKELLQDPDLSITAVAFDTGFNDPSYFGRVFKKEFGVTPLEWRAGASTFGG